VSGGVEAGRPGADDRDAEWVFFGADAHKASAA
jgi:hypothetical protein